VAATGPESRSGRLFVVATPIGNLADVTLRALEILAAVPLVAAEDTRLTRRLLDRHGIRARLVSHHAQSAPSRTSALLTHLRGGRDLALVTDAGTPGISDPGESLVAAWAGEGGQVVPIPGASAVTAAAAVSGLTGPRWSFEGFLPRSGTDRRERLARIAADDRATILFEAPGRVAATLADLADACGPDRPAAVCRELTKVHEQILRGPLHWLVEEARQGRLPARGEHVIVVGSLEGGGRGARGPDAARGAADGPDGGTEPRPKRGAAGARRQASETDLEAARAAVEGLVASGVARGEAARRVAAATGLARRRLYGPDR
jgi:16S rRNA (cytidine1402-2'-O)-methyltransferase